MEFERRPFECTVYQCSSCRYTTALKQNVNAHLARCEPGASILQSKGLCHVTLPGQHPAAVANSYNTTNSFNRTVNIVLPAGSDAEYTKMLEVLRNDLANTLLSLDLERPETWPAAIFSKLQQREPALRNVEVQGNMAIETRENGDKVPVPRLQKARKAQGTLYETLGLAVETTQEEDDDVAYVSGKIMRELRRKLPNASGTTLEEAARMYASRAPKFARIDSELQACVREAARELAAAYPLKRRQ